MSAFLGFKQAFARERLTVSNSVKTLTASVYGDTANAGGETFQRASGARVSVETAGIRFTEEGTDPSAAGGSEVGTAAAAADLIYLEGYAAIAKFKAIRSSGTDAVIEVTYYR